jgi:homoserine acetyltransferase
MSGAVAAPRRMPSVGSLIPLIRHTLAAKQRVALLGDFPVESGECIKNRQIGYRTFGRLNPSNSNAVVVTPWFQGTSAQLARAYWTREAGGQLQIFCHCR